MKKNILIIPIIVFGIYSCQKDKNEVVQQKQYKTIISNGEKVTVVENLGDYETFIYEDKSYLAPTNETVKKNPSLQKELTKDEKELEKIFEEALVTHYDGSGTTRLFKNIESYNRWLVSMGDAPINSENDRDFIDFETDPDAGTGGSSGSSGSGRAAWYHLYEHRDYSGSMLYRYKPADLSQAYMYNLDPSGFDEKTSSVTVNNGSLRLYEHLGWGGRLLTIVDNNLSTSWAVGYSNLTNVRMSFWYTWNDKVSSTVLD